MKGLSTTLRRTCTAIFLAVFPLAAIASDVVIDGRLTEGEWADATHVTDFRSVQPFTQSAGSLRTEAWYKATPEGLAIAFRNHQPASVERRRQKTRRDEDAQADRVNLMVDYDGDGQRAFNFCLLLGGGIQDGVLTQGRGSNDWDGDWRHAVGEDGDDWIAEMLIPWHTTTMRNVGGDTRRIGLYLDRVIGATGERMAWPAVTWERPQFIAQFNQVDVPAYRQSLLAVTPYVALGRDLARTGQDVRNVGADVFWKPGGHFQLSATLNPDFGQVESDDLVVNFSAQESFFGDKRPFFTENQSIFDFGMLLDNSQLIYTRRVGGASDDGHGMAQIGGALKLNGNLAGMSYGLLWAEERGDAGRSFRAARVTRPVGSHVVGVMATQVQRPWLHRDATVIGIDEHWKPSAGFQLTANVAQSRIRQDGVQRNRLGASLLAEQELRNGWHQRWIAMHYDDGFDINDFGYLGRANMDYAAWEVGRRITQLPQDSLFSSHHWRWRVSGANTASGMNIQREFRVQRESKLRDGGAQNFGVTLRAPSHDDEVTFYNGALRRRQGFEGYFNHEPGRHGDWQWWFNSDVGYGMGVERSHHSMQGVGLGLRHFFSDRLNASVNFYALRDGEWLLWRGGGVIGSFDSRRLEAGGTVNWNISPRQELRIKLQVIGLSAHARRGWNVQSDGGVQPSPVLVADFGLHTLGFQMRYRYELAPLSNLYIVYARGGYDRDQREWGYTREFNRAFALRRDEQLFVKLAYRFEL